MLWASVFVYLIAPHQNLSELRFFCLHQGGQKSVQNMILVLPLFLAFLDLSGALTLEPKKEEFILSSGSTWEIRCSGKYPLDWDYPGNGQVTIRNSSVTISHVVTSKSEYTSVLRLKEAHYLDTGYYFCKYANTTEPNVSKYIQSILDVQTKRNGRN